MAKTTGVDWNLIKELDKTALEHAHSAPILRMYAVWPSTKSASTRDTSTPPSSWTRRIEKFLQVVEGKSQKVMRPFFESPAGRRIRQANSVQVR